MDIKEIQKKALRDYFPAEIEGIGSFETLSSFLKYCNVSNTSARTAHENHSEQWMEELINKDTGPFYFEDVEYKTKSLIAKRLGITSKKLTNLSRDFGGLNVQEYLDHLEDNKLHYKGYPVYNANTLSEATELTVRACSGILRRLKECYTIEEKQEKLHKLVNSRRQVIQIVKQLDPNVESVTDFTKKYNMPKETLMALEEMDTTFEQRKRKMKEYVKAI
ncbi:MAG: hypothetical protein ABS904_00740 [Solibacillus isronensis]